MSTKLEGLQILRGGAALVVIISHTIGRAIRDGVHFPEYFIQRPEIVILGHLGVDVFFVISGFIMFYIHGTEFGKPFVVKRFLVSRALRVVPIYWLLSLLALMLLLFLPHLFSFREGVEVPWVLGSFFFVPVTTSYGLSSPLLGVGWTLNYEVFFYCMFAICLFFSRKVGLIVALLYFFGVLLLGRDELVHTKNYFDLLLSYMLLEFLMGIALAYFYLNYKSSMMRVRILFLITSIAIYSYSFFNVPHTYLDRMILWGSGAFFLVGFAVCFPFKAPAGFARSCLIRLGDFSYAAYLIQVFTIPAFSIVLIYISKNFYTVNYIVYIVCVVSATLFISYLFWLLVEKPMTTFLKKIPYISRSLRIN